MTITIDSLFNWSIQYLDVKDAYLNAKLHSNIYINLSEDYKDYSKGFCKLNKALYRFWFCLRFVLDGSIAWMLRQQQSVTRYTAEAEYIVFFFFFFFFKNYKKGGFLKKNIFLKILKKKL